MPSIRWRLYQQILKMKWLQTEAKKLIGTVFKKNYQTYTTILFPGNRSVCSPLAGRVPSQKFCRTCQLPWQAADLLLWPHRFPNVCFWLWADWGPLQMWNDLQTKKTKDHGRQWSKISDVLNDSLKHFNTIESFHNWRTMGFKIDEKRTFTFKIFCYMFINNRKLSKDW